MGALTFILIFTVKKSRRLEFQPKNVLLETGPAHTCLSTPVLRRELLGGICGFLLFFNGGLFVMTKPESFLFSNLT